MKKRVLPVLAVGVLVVSGCAGAPSGKDAGLAGCDAFAHYLGEAGGDPEGMDRSTTVEQVRVEFSKTSEALPADLGAALDGLDRTKDGAVSSWVVAADTFAGKCREAGWTP